MRGIGRGSSRYAGGCRPDLKYIPRWRPPNINKKTQFKLEARFGNDILEFRKASGQNTVVLLTKSLTLMTGDEMELDLETGSLKISAFSLATTSGKRHKLKDKALPAINTRFMVDPRKEGWPLEIESNSPINEASTVPVNWSKPYSENEAPTEELLIFEKNLDKLVHLGIFEENTTTPAGIKSGLELLRVLSSLLDPTFS